MEPITQCTLKDTPLPHPHPHDFITWRFLMLGVANVNDFSANVLSRSKKVSYLKLDKMMQGLLSLFP